MVLLDAENDYCGGDVAVVASAVVFCLYSGVTKISLAGNGAGFIETGVFIVDFTFSRKGLLTTLLGLAGVGFGRSLKRSYIPLIAKPTTRIMSIEKCRLCRTCSLGCETKVSIIKSREREFSRNAIKFWQVCPRSDYMLFLLPESWH